MLTWLKKQGQGEPSVISAEVRGVLDAAAAVARGWGHDYVGTEHVLAAVVRAPGGGGVAALSALGVSASAVEAALAEHVSPGGVEGGRRGSGPLPYTSRVLRALQLAQAAARAAGASPVGTEHLLIGLLREETGPAARALTRLGVTAAALLAAGGGARGGAAGGGGTGGGAAGVARAGIELDDGSSASIYEQIIAQIQELVATGGLRPGERLPTVRRLADELDIAPGTVARAYRELERLGVLATDGARGTRVAARQGAALPQAARPEALLGLLRPVAIAGFHLGATPDELRGALNAAMADIFDERPPGEGGAAVSGA